MIIELFGPPGAGKTTFARALTARLRERGHIAELKLSCRPTERLPVLDPCGTTPVRYQAVVVHRLTRPVLEMLRLARHPVVNARNVSTALNFVRALPPKKVTRSIREIQYITRLSHSWHQASSAGHIVLFDQAYVQALCSLALLSRTPDDTLLAHALDFAPKPDLLIRLDAPFEVLKARLCDRKRLQSAIERLFELDLETNLKSIRIIDRLHDLLRNRGQSVTCASSLDPQSLREGVERIDQQLAANIRTERMGRCDADGPLLPRCR